MVISKTPYRISFFGGGTDYPSWFNKNEGHVISASIDKFLYISCRHLPPFFDHKIRLVYSKIEEGNKVSDLKHKSAKAVLKYLNINKDIEIHYDGDLPARSGIGSSSAFTIGLLNALYSYKNKQISKKNLATKGIFIEQKIIKENVGSQDQIATSFGGLNYIKFKKNSSFNVNKIKFNDNVKKKLFKNILLFHTGIFRTADDISKDYINKLNLKSKYMYSIYDIVNEAKKNLESGNIDDFGKLLNETWMMKKQISKLITNNYINEIYNQAIELGAFGGKLLGAGGGGFMMFYMPQKKQKLLINKFSKLLHVPISFENNGSSIVYKS